MKLRRMPITVASMLITVLSLSQTVSAHVAVKPAEVTTASFQTFTIGVPNEKDSATTSVRLVMPTGLKYVTPTQKAGWQIQTDKTGTGEDASVTAITWSGGAVNPGLRDEFTFSAQVPDKATELQWKAYQTYVDGTVVSWDKASEGGHGEDANSGPFSITKVVSQTAIQDSINTIDNATANAEATSQRSLYIAVSGVVLGLVGIYLATRKK